MTCVKLEAFLDLALLASALRMAPYVDYNVVGPQGTAPGA